MLKSKKFVIVILTLLALSVALNARFYILWSSSHDELYELIGKTHVNDQQILQALERGDVENAKSMLRREIEISGNIIAICALEKCTESIIGVTSARP